jgi:hypothetical protein
VTDIPPFNEYFINSERDRIKSDMEAATAVGDTKRVLSLSDKLSDLERNYGTKKPAEGGLTAPKPGEAPTGQKAPPWTSEEARAELTDITGWFGSDPKLTKSAIELANYIDVNKFKTVKEYAAAVKKAVDKEHDLEPEELEDDEPPAEDEEEGEEGEAQVRRSRRARPTGGGVAGAGNRVGVGSRVPTKFSQIPDKAARDRLSKMAANQKLDEKTVVKNWFEMEQKKKANRGRR